MKRLVLLTMILALVFSMSACSKKTNEPAGSAEEPVDDLEKPTYVIEAGGLELKYSEKWKDKVTVTVTEDRAAFACGETQLFDLVFNSEEGIVLGTVRGEKNTVISVVDYELEQDDPELIEMQEDVNVILRNLARDYDFVADEAITDDTTATFDIETSVTTLKYPARWRNKVSVDVTKQGVTFTSGETRLFALMFTDVKGGYLLGTYDGTPIYIIDYPITTDEESKMQQDVNVILQNLQQDSNFKIA